MCATLCLKFGSSKSPSFQWRSKWACRQILQAFNCQPVSWRNCLDAQAVLLHGPTFRDKPISLKPNLSDTNDHIQANIAAQEKVVHVLGCACDSTTSLPNRFVNFVQLVCRWCVVKALAVSILVLWPTGRNQSRSQIRWASWRRYRSLAWRPRLPLPVQDPVVPDPKTKAVSLTPVRSCGYCGSLFQSCLMLWAKVGDLCLLATFPHSAELAEVVPLWIPWSWSPQTSALVS
jgi:hypothetical protein